MKVRIKQMFKILSLTILFLVTSLFPINSVAQELTEESGKSSANDISNDVVKSITLSKYKIRDSEQVVIKIEYDDSKIKIQGGDIITVSWPTTGYVTLTGYARKIKLYLDEIYIGDANITQSGATIVFLESVNEFYNVAGWLQFTASGSNTTQTSEENIGTAEIKSGNVTATLEIVKPASTGGGSTGGENLLYKTGGIAHDNSLNINWIFPINRNKVFITEPVIIKDYLQTGHSIIPETIEVYTNDSQGKIESFKGLVGMEQLAVKYPGSKVIIDQTSQTLDVTLSPDLVSQKSANVLFRTLIENENQLYFVNNSQAWYKADGYDDCNGKDFNHTVKNIVSGAGIEGTQPGELKIYKFVNSSGKPIEGASFALKRTDGEVIHNGLTEIVLTSDANGIANITGLPLGGYSLKEISAPDWIDFDVNSSEVIEFEIKESDTEGVFLEIENDIKKTSVFIKKTWNDVNNQNNLRPSNITVELYGNEKYCGSAILDAQNFWEYTFGNIPAFTDEGEKINYTVKEKPVSNYSSTVEGNQQDGFIIKNSLIYAGYQFPETGFDYCQRTEPAGCILIVIALIAVLLLSLSKKSSHKKSRKEILK